MADAIATLLPAGRHRSRIALALALALALAVDGAIVGAQVDDTAEAALRSLRPLVDCVASAGSAGN